MIFKKNNDWATQVKNGPAPAKAPPFQRREPALTAHAPSAAPQTPGAANGMQASSQPTARRNPAMAPANFTRNDQLRKLTVGRDISLNGEITTCDHLVVEGNVTATIKGGKIIEITDTGCFVGSADIDQADISGKFDGELTVRGKLIIRATAIVTGMIRYHQIQVDTGAAINGELSALESQPVQRASPASTQAEVGAETGRLHNFTAINNEPGFLKASA